MTHQIALDGRSLVLSDLGPVLRGEPVQLTVTDAARQAVQTARELVDHHVDSGAAVYGLTTGFGKLKNVAIERGDLVQLQENLIVSHCCGVGEDMPLPEVRVAQVLRLNGLVRGNSGIRVELVDRLLEFFNRGFVPVVPQQGSVGASGDLAPLAHMTASYMGYGGATFDGRKMSAREALAAMGVEPVALAAKEGLALINGTEISKGVSVGVITRAMNLSKAADILVSLSIEALHGSRLPFGQRLAELKGHPGHFRTAANVTACLANSGIMESHADCDRVQDPYSLRCAPQVHGAYKSALAHVCDIFRTEINGVTDNPVLFPETGEVVSAGLFHGAPVSMVMDYLGLAMCSIANIAERRTEQLVNPDLSGMPAFLTSRPGLNSGMMIAQVAAAALASENKIYAHPASVDTIPTSANQEDHVPMAATAARKARMITDNTERVMAIEYLCAAQAREFNLETRGGDGAEAAYRLMRTKVTPLVEDRYLADDIEAARQLIASGELVRAVEEVTGPLES
ncbi:MAG: histidine ammonia-lyase [Planctomycetota bacterium]|jgi:histidine ammonia-lyase